MFDLNNITNVTPKIQEQAVIGKGNLNENIAKHEGEILVVKQSNGVVRKHRTLSPEEFRNKLTEKLQALVEQ